MTGEVKCMFCDGSGKKNNKLRRSEACGWCGGRGSVDRFTPYGCACIMYIEEGRRQRSRAIHKYNDDARNINMAIDTVKGSVSDEDWNLIGPLLEKRELKPIE